MLSEEKLPIMIKLANDCLKTLNELEPLYTHLTKQIEEIKKINHKSASTNPEELILINGNKPELKYETNLSKTSRELEEAYNELKISFTFNNQELEFDINFDPENYIKKIVKQQNEKINEENNKHHSLDIASEDDKFKDGIIGDNTKKYAEYFPIHKTSQDKIDEIKDSSYDELYTLVLVIEAFASEVRHLKLKIDSTLELKESLKKDVFSLDYENYLENNKILQQYKNLIFKPFNTTEYDDLELNNETILVHTFDKIDSFRKIISDYINKNSKIKGAVNYEKGVVDDEKFVAQNEEELSDDKPFNNDEPKPSIKNLFNKLEKLLDELKSFMNKIMEKIRAYKTKPEKYTEDLLKKDDNLDLISSNRRDSETDSLEKSIDKSSLENEVENSSSSNRKELKESNSSFVEKIGNERDEKDPEKGFF